MPKTYSYGLTSVIGDYYAGIWPTEAFSRYRIRYDTSEQTKSELYLEALPLFTRAASNYSIIHA